MLPEHYGNGAEVLNLGQPECRIAAARPCYRIHVRAGLNQRFDSAWLIFMYGMHQRGPVVHASALIHIFA